ncbi:hypothetical protein pdam_00024328 [Pocillopora damicornis]|uniref:Uncharacterized protein n=1 Tax=Pocillopora damicornis TaxID=46731 RepID=A0A3M6T4V4_POCDA|nr:hypothetical protein pdam_00024328 [Pocillopora damicornis]
MERLLHTSRDQINAISEFMLKKKMPLSSPTVAKLKRYRGKITKSTLLDKATFVAAKANLLLEDTSAAAALEEPVVKELLMQENKLTDKLRQIPISGGVEPPPRDDEAIISTGGQLLTATLVIPTPKKKAATSEGRLAKKPRQTKAEHLKCFGNWEPWEKIGSQ